MSFSLDAIQLQEYQPNRYPFLMIDYITEVEPGQFANGYKNLSNNEWYFPVHFKDGPNMPGVLQLESMAQMLTVALTTLEGLKGSITHALEHKVKFRREVKPGERLDIYAEILSWKRGVCKGYARATVNDELASEAHMLITIPEIIKSYIPKGT